MKKRRLKWRPFENADPKYHIELEYAVIVSLKGRLLCEAYDKPGERVYVAAILNLYSRNMVDDLRAGQSVLAQANTCRILIDVERDCWIYFSGFRVVNWPKRFAFTLHDRDRIYKDMQKHVERFLRPETSTNR